MRSLRLPALLIGALGLAACTLPFDADLLTDGAGPGADGGPDGDGGVPSDGAPPDADAGPISSCLVGTVLAAGDHHACVIDIDAGLHCWGNNQDGQLGLGVDDEVVPRPSPVGSALWVAVDLGATHSCAIDDAGDLYCWGSNANGQLGSPGSATQTTPRKVSTLEGDWQTVSAGSTHTCGIFGDAGELYCWGSNASGALGRIGATELPGRVGAEAGWTSVSAGWANNTCGVREGELYCWGDASRGATGHGDEVDRALPERVGMDSDWATVSCGHNMACGQKVDGQVLCWGYNRFGQVGVHDSSAEILVPTAMEAPGALIDVSVGQYHNCGIDPEGSARCWGYGSRGVRGNGLTDTDHIPSTVLGGRYRTVASGGNFTCALDEAGHVRCWGDNTLGPIGDGQAGHLMDRLVPHSLRDGVAEVSAGTQNTCVRTSGGEIFCWGLQAFGSGPGGTISTPTLLSAGPYDALSRGDFHGLLIEAPSAALGWGANGFGQVGDGSMGARDLPVSLSSLASVAVLAAGSESSCAITDAGALHCWGGNTAGQLGLGDMEDRDTPTEVSPDGWTAVDLGNAVTCGVRTGRLFCWGHNEYGQLGLGDTDARDVPTQVGIDTEWVDVAADDTTCAIDSAGALYCWGRNVAGSVGNGTQTNALTPTRIGTDTWTDIDTDEDETCGVRSDGGLFCWGDNDYGELGLGDREDRHAPAQVGTETDWTAVDVGSQHGCGLRGESLYCWGRAEYGRLGDGVDSRDASSLEPVAHCLDG